MEALRRSKTGLKSAQIEIRMFLWVDLGIYLPTQHVTVFREGRTLLDQGCPNFDEIFFGASVHEKIEISPFRTFFGH